VKFIFVFLGLSFYIQYQSPKSEMDRSEHRIMLRFICDDFDDEVYYPTPLFERKDLLAVLADLSIRENPSIRFISTNQTEEIMEVNGRRTSWKEAWEVYLNGKKISPYDLKTGIRVGEKDKIVVKLEAVERVFGTPTKHGE